MIYKYIMRIVIVVLLCSVAQATVYSDSLDQIIRIISTGHINATVDICIDGGNCLASAGAVWTNTSGNLTFTGGNVGIGTLTPDLFTLQVAGDIGPNKTDTGRVGGTEVMYMDTDLSASDASYFGEVANDNSGFSVSGVGDVNGDGYDDFIIGAYNNDEPVGTNEGQSYLILGNESGWAMDTELSASDASFWGEEFNDNSGWSVSGVGDVNGDGYDDFLIGAANNNDGGSTAGQSYLILGNESGWAMDTDLGVSDASFWGEDSGDRSGISVSGAGDVNGDGYDDFMIGAYLDEDGGENAGQTYLILGKASGWAMDTDLSASDASFWGEDAFDQSGWSISDAGDVNGDGYDDILIGARFNNDGGTDDEGQTYLIFGKASGWAMDTDLGVSDASFLGEATNDFSGNTISGAGDVNGDGYDDFLIGAYANNEGGTDDEGQTYLIFGKASGWAMDTDLGVSDASFWGEDSNDFSGRSLSSIGDINADGFDDFIIGAEGDDDGGGTAGQTYLIFGKASGWAMDTELSTSDASYWGEEIGDQSGYSISGTGDVNGDGYDDILIGAYLNNEGGTDDEGQTYLIFGEPRQFDTVNARHVKAGTSLAIGTNIFIRDETISADSQLYLDANFVHVDGGLTTLGYVGIGNKSPDYPLDVVGDVNSDDCYREAGVQIAGTCASDLRLKKNISTLHGALDIILKLNPVRFNWRVEEFPKLNLISESETGLIAQEVQQVLPHLVKEKKSGYLGVRYGMELNMLTIQAIKELNKIKNENIIKLKNKNKMLQKAFCEEKPLHSICTK